MCVYAAMLISGCRGLQQPQWGAIASVAMAIGSVFAAAWGPFVLNGTWSHALGRLFPFGRGLVHAYWAANAWSFYCALDKLLCMCASVSMEHKGH
jgi:alpha-1,3-glucosyltransferase